MGASSGHHGDLIQAAKVNGEEGEIMDITDDEGRSRSGLRGQTHQSLSGLASHNRRTSDLNA